MNTLNRFLNVIVVSLTVYWVGTAVMFELLSFFLKNFSVLPPILPISLNFCPMHPLYLLIMGLGMATRL